MIFTRTVSLKMVQSYEKSELHKKVTFSLQFNEEAKSTEFLLYFTMKNKLGGPIQAFWTLTQVNLDSLSKA